MHTEKLEDSKKVSWQTKWRNQAKLMLWKNWKLSWRRKSSTIAQIIAPSLFIFSLWILQQALQGNNFFGDLYDVVRNPSPVQIKNVPACFGGLAQPDAWCYTFAYVPNNNFGVERVVDLIRNQNNPVIPKERVIGFATPKELDDYLWSHPNTTNAAYIFNFTDNPNTPLPDYSFIVQFNSSGRWSHGVIQRNADTVVVPLIYAAERALLTYITENGTKLEKFDLNILNFPHPEVIAVDVIGTNGPAWFFAALMFNFVVGLGAIVLEKEMKLRDIMKIMGLYDSAYWTTWFITLLIFSTISVFVLIITGCIFQFNFFLKNAFGLYFWLLWLFALSLVSMTFLISTLVKKAGNSTAIGFLVFILGYMIQLAGSYIYSSNSSQGLRGIFALFSPTMLQLGLSELGFATEKESYPGMRWADVADASKTKNGVFSMQRMFLWLLFDSIFYMLLALYLDNVLPNEHGVRRPLYYFLQPSYWSGKSRKQSKKVKVRGTNEEELNEMDSDVKIENETVREGKTPSNTVVTIKDLTKIYDPNSCGNKNQFYAVNELCLHIESDTLFCLLGPNGAGKTTTIHMMVGFHEPTSGDAEIYGLSIKDNISQVQQLIGVCPQFDILWPELTGEEHLYMFSGLKGLNKYEIPKETKRLLKAVELVEARNVRSASYSGGMKRRLSVAIGNVYVVITYFPALIGNPKLVYLDEPTTGMDPISRRKVWDIIEAEKKDKVIVLTTHSMEEADTLSDKIGIMTRGKLQCVGSSLHLKQKFGSGYRITIGTSEKKVEKTQAFVQKYVPGATLSGAAIGGYMTFVVPRDSTSSLVPFFKKLEKRKERLEIHDLQLGLTTLEEVFLSIAEKAELKAIQDRINLDTKIDVEPLQSSEKQNLKLKYSKKDQFKALFVKTATLQKRETKTVICQVATPFVLILLLFLLNKLVNNLVEFTPIYEELYPKVSQPFALLTYPDGVDTEVFYNQESVHPLLQSLNATGTQMLYSKEAGINTGDYKNGTGFLGSFIPRYGTPMPTYLREFSQFGQAYREITYATVPLAFPFNMVELGSKEEMQDVLFNAFDGPPKYIGAYHFNEIDFQQNRFEFDVYYNRSLSFGWDLLAQVSRLVTAVSRNIQGTPANIYLQGIKIFPTKDSILSVDIITLAGPFFYVLILQQLLPVFLSTVAYEKETKIREMMSMMGLNMKLYWIVQYLFNFILYFAVMIFLIIAGLIFRFRVFTANNFLSYFILYFIWGHVLIALSFLLSVFFSTKRSALIFGYFAILAISLICNVYVGTVVGDIGNVSIARVNALSLFPPFALYRGLVYLASEVAWDGPGYRISTIDTDVVNLASCYYFLIGEWFVIMIIWWYLEQVIPSVWGVKKHPLFFLGCGKHKASDDVANNDNNDSPNDVKKEKESVFTKVPNDEYPIQVLNMRKIYPGTDGNKPKVAVKGVSFGVKDSSCFGILGHNGAGKTTLIHMLIGLFKPTSGTAYIRGCNLTDQMESIHTFMGICPQHDVLWDTLSGEEHLLFYGRIKGLEGKELDERVASVLKKVRLYEARKKMVQKYSGGMKRRLSVAISIVGRPRVLYLDEPSTGLDPKSRQDLWKVINEAKQDAAVILTTHSMEEADAICDRLMIMAEGEIKCIGVSADLKNRFGEGYKLAIQVAKGKSQEPAHQFVQEVAPGASLLNHLAGTRNYQVSKSAISLRKAFEELDGNKDRLNITDWAITNTTLEEVFLRISNATGIKEKSGKEEEDMDMDGEKYVFSE